MRLIDADAVLKEMKETYCTGCNNYNGVICKACEHMDDMDFIEDAPTIDAQPVKRGKWIPMDETTAKCSVCGWWQKSNGKDKTGKALIHNAVYRYCTACGAYMRGEEDERN